MTRADRIDWALHFAMTAMPSSLCSALGARLAPLLGRKANPAAHSEAAALLAALRPDWAADPVALAAAMDRLWDCTGGTFAEFAISPRLLKSGRVAISDAALLDSALNSDRPLI